MIQQEGGPVRTLCHALAVSIQGVRPSELLELLGQPPQLARPQRPGIGLERVCGAAHLLGHIGAQGGD